MKIVDFSPTLVYYQTILSSGNDQQNNIENDFVRHLCSELGGDMKQELAQKHVQQVKYLCGEIGPDVDDPSFTRELKDVITEKMDKKVWGFSTIRIYLSSVRKFCEYLKKMKHLGFQNYSKIDVSNLDVVLSFIKDWTKSLKKKSNAQQKARAVKSLSDSSKITPDDIVVYKKSSRAVLAEKILDSKKNVILKLLNIDVHTLVRNFICLHLALTTGHRAGCITNMTVSEFETAKKFIKNENHLVFVEDHKSSNDGPARVPISPRLYLYMEAYKDFCRPPSESCALLLNWGRLFACLLFINFYHAH